METPYRIVKTNDKTDPYMLIEVTKHTNGRISMPEYADLYGNNIQHMKMEVELMLQAFELPVLDIKATQHG